MAKTIEHTDACQYTSLVCMHVLWAWERLLSGERTLFLVVCEYVISADVSVHVDVDQLMLMY